MTKSKSKFKGILKSAALGFAVILCSAFFPANAAVALAENFEGEHALSNTYRIEINKDTTGNSNSSIVTKGDEFTVPVGVYQSPTAGEHVIGTSLTSNITTSKVEVFYANGDLVKTISGVADSSALQNQTFIADRIGSYKITYTVVENGTTYTYDYSVICEADEANFEFKGNDSNLIPSVYDTVLSASLEGENKNKDIKIPLPSVVDEDGEEILTSADSQYYILDANGSGIPSIENSKNCFVYISLTNGNDIVSIQGEAGDYYIDGDTLVQNATELNNQEYKLTYTFYQLNENGRTFITSTSRTFTVRNGYYYTNSSKETSGYSLVSDWATSVPNSAVVGVEVSLPAVTVTTSATNSPSSEAVEAYYEVSVNKMVNGRYDDPVTSEVYDSEKHTFKAVEEGSYQIVYTIRDFYGNTVEDSFYLDNVRDNQSARVYMYDAGTDTVQSDGSYSSESEYKLASQTVARNIIMYAIGGSDNMVQAQDLTLRREIRLNTTVRFNITEQKYNAYNLIFAPTANGNTGTDAVYKQIADDNYEIRKQMAMAGLDYTDGTAVKDWMQGKYLLVTTTGKDVDGNLIAGENPDINDPAVIDQFIEAGYAFIKPVADSYATFNAGSYNFYYFASDGTNAETPKYYPITLSSSTDEAVPTITFDTDLQNIYLSNEIVEFDVAGASDTVDGRLEVVTAYRYLAQDGVSPVVGGETTKTISYMPLRWNASDNNKWYTTRDEQGLVVSENWYYDKTLDSYTIDLRDKPADARYIEILCYAIDDSGNVGFYNRKIGIADTTDSDSPVLYKVVGAPDADQSYNAPQSISLPTLYFTDQRVEYMSASVVVYKISEDESGAETSRQVMQSTNMTTRLDTYRGIFEVDGGIFNASTSGKYQAVITVSDSADHSVSTYFTYNVSGGVVIEDPVIDNITSEPIEVEIDESYKLTTPSIAVTDSTEYGYIGLSDDDANTSTYYTPIVTTASNNTYDLTQYEFIGKSTGTYKLQYEVYLIRYAMSEVTDTATEGKLYIDAQGRLKYVDAPDKEYFIYLDENPYYGQSEEENPGQNVTDKYIMYANTSITGVGGEALDVSILADTVKLFVLTSDVQTITVKDVIITVSVDDDAYAITKYPTINTEKPTPITIVKPNVSVSGFDKGNRVDLAESTVQISRTSGSTTTTLATITLEEWERHFDDDPSNRNFRIEGSTISLLLRDNGRYTIKYSIQAADHLGQKIGDTKTLEYTISNGDVEAPTIDLTDDFVRSTYQLGDKLVLNMAGIEVNDNSTDKDTLLATMVVTLTNTDTEQSWPLKNDPNAAEGAYIYEHTFESAGNYTLSITVTDDAGITGSSSVSFTVTTDDTDPVNVTEVLGGVLIGISVALLAGVVIYFIVSKVKLDKREKSYKAKTAKKEDEKKED